MEPDFSQWCPLAWGAMGTKWKTRYSILIKFLLLSLFFNCEGDQVVAQVAKRGCSVSMLHIQKPDKQSPWQAALFDLAWTGAFTRKSPEMPSNLNPSVILWFCFVFSFNKVHKAFFQQTFSFLAEHVFKLYFRMLNHVLGKFSFHCVKINTSYRPGVRILMDGKILRTGFKSDKGGKIQWWRSWH